ncbi:hypothetical protein JCM10449v2_006414 [Rhodotorula kratochvilovae]
MDSDDEYGNYFAPLSAAALAALDTFPTTAPDSSSQARARDPCTSPLHSEQSSHADGPLASTSAVPQKRAVGRPADSPGTKARKAAVQELKKVAKRQEKERARVKAAQAETELRARRRRELDEEAERAARKDPKRYPRLNDMKEPGVPTPRVQSNLMAFFGSGVHPQPSSDAAVSGSRPRSAATPADPASPAPHMPARALSPGQPGGSLASLHEAAGPEAVAPAEAARAPPTVQPLAGSGGLAPAEGGTTSMDDEVLGGEGQAFAAQLAWLAETTDEMQLTALHRPLRHSSDPKNLGVGSFFLPRPALASHFYNNVIPEPEQLYAPRFFYWDPFPLVAGGAQCPKASCARRRLARHGRSNRPRRVADAKDCIYLFGQRYRCGTSAGTSGCGQTFIAWDPRLLDQLPEWLRAAFPFVLTHRGACTSDVLDQLRAAMSHSVGAVAFSSMMRRTYRLEYDKRRIMYLQSIADKHFLPSGELKPSVVAHPTFAPFSAFDDPQGYAGYVPSAPWFSEFYVKCIESEAPAMEQRASLLSCAIGAIDHSHKIVKYICRVRGEPTFTGLLTVTNEYGEIKQCALVPTKAHDQFAPALAAINTHLKLYGNAQPTLFYTDNVRGDAGVLRHAFPSLTHNLAPPINSSPYAHLPAFTCPATIVVLSSLATAQDALAMLLRESAEGEIVGFDAEWNVQQDDFGRVQRGLTVAIVQIAWRDRVFIIQLALILRRSRALPMSLVNLILSSSIIKAGVSVKADMTLILNAYRHSGTGTVSPDARAAGALELSTLAKSKGASPARSSLASLVASVLGHDLPKPSDTRVSALWEVETLSDEQLAYAACDAAASRGVALALEAMSLARGARLPREELEPGTSVLVVGKDESSLLVEAVLVCCGDSFDPGVIPEAFDPTAHPNITATRSLLRVTRIFTPGALLPPTYNARIHANQPATLATLAAASLPSAMFFVVTTTQLRACGVVDATASTPAEMLVDNASASELLDPLLKRLASSPPSLLPLSRILIDIWHLMDRIPTSKRHGCIAAFSRAFSAALFVLDPTDRALLEARFIRAGSSWDLEVLRRPDYVWQRCRRTVPPPHQLVPQLDAVFRLYGPMKDAKTGLPLFNKAAWHAASRIISDVIDGFVSDPPDVELFSVLRDCGGPDGTLKDGVRIYRCSRGTNFTEGGVHRNLRHQFASSAVSARFASARLLEYQTNHNLLVRPPFCTCHSSLMSGT